MPLVYSPDLLPQGAVSCDCRNRTVRQALELMLDGTGLTFRATRTQVLIFPRQSPASQVGTVVGRIFDAEKGDPVASVVARLETGQGVLTDASGRFILRGVPAGSHRLEVTGIGWEPWSDGVVVPAGDTVSVVVRLHRCAVPLPEIIVAPGTFGILESVPPGTVRTITRQEMEATPQLGEDVFRSLKRLPGVTAHDISTRLSVRGSLEREVLVRLDGIDLYEPYHLKDWDGAFGIVDMSALQGVELKVGGFGVEYGDHGAGVLDMKSRTAVGPAKTTATLNLSHLGIMRESGFANDKGSWLVSARQGSLGLLMRLVGADKRLSPQFYDVFGKVTYQPTAGQLISVHVLRAGDNFHLDAETPASITDETGRIQSDWGSTYGWVTWNAEVWDRASSHAQLWAGRVSRFRQGYVDTPGSIGTPEAIAVRDDRRFDFTGFREQVDFEVSPSLLLRVGGEALLARANYDYYANTETAVLGVDRVARLRSDTVEVALKPEGHRVSAYASARGRAGERLVGEVGVRYDRVSQTDEAHFAPRLQASLELAPQTTLQVSAGRYYQSQGIGELQVGDGQTLYSPSERSDLLALGLEQEIGRRFHMRVEAYDRRIADEQPRFIGLRQELSIFPEQGGDRLRIDPARGRTRGIELVLKGSAGHRWSWSASYALAKAEDDLPQTTPCTPSPTTCLDNPWVPRGRDQRHAVDLDVEYRPSAGWHFAAAWTFHTGWPGTPWTYTATLKADSTLFWSREFGPLNSVRLPAYHRLDLRATRAFRLRGGALEIYADLFNVYNRKNRASLAYSGRYLGGENVETVRTNQGEDLLPFLPMIGLRYRF